MCQKATFKHIFIFKVLFLKNNLRDQLTCSTFRISYQNVFNSVCETFLSMAFKNESFSVLILIRVSLSKTNDHSYKQKG